MWSYAYRNLTHKHLLFGDVANSSLGKFYVKHSFIVAVEEN